VTDLRLNAIRRPSSSSCFTPAPGVARHPLISTDNINPRTMNAVYPLPPRLPQGKLRGKEMPAGGGLDNRQFNDFAKEAAHAVLRSAGHGLDASRLGTAPIRSARSAPPTARPSTSGRSAKSGCRNSTPPRRKRVSPIAIADARKFRVFQGHRGADARHRPLLSQDDRRASVKDAPEGTQHFRGTSADDAR
jgi:hypothetical protein